MKVSHMGKMGDMTYALPVIRALARIHGEPVELITSPLCIQMVPLLVEQIGYLKSVEVDGSKEYRADGRILIGWDFFKHGEGFNLSQQPAFYEDGAPYLWTHGYMKLAGVTQLEPSDFMIFPSLVNHRRWLFGHDVRTDGRSDWAMPTVIVAPECESVPEAPRRIWQSIVTAFDELGFQVIVIGKRWDGPYQHCLDMRNRTSVPTMARMVAESYGLIGGHSFPVHLARKTETPFVCLQEMVPGLERSKPIDTPFPIVAPEQWELAVEMIRERAKTVNPFVRV